MAMTKEEWIAKKQIMDILGKQGYPKYAHLFSYFDLNLTADPKVVGYMIPDKGIICINRNLDIEQVSTIVRHEILHEYLSHKLRMERHVGKDKWDKRSPALQRISNIAGDYEISNRGYTDRDKDIARSIKLGDQVLQGLVTEDEHPDWVDLPLEDMYDKLLDEYEKDKDKFEQMLQNMPDMNSSGDQQIQDAEEIEREANDITKGGTFNPDHPEDSEEAKDGSGGQGEDSDDKDKEDKDGEGSSDSDKEQEEKAKKAAKEIAKAAGELADEMKKAKEKQNGGPGDGKVFQDKEEKIQQKKYEGRLKAIKKAFKELVDNKDTSLIDEVETQLDKGKAARQSRELAAYKANPLHKFQHSINEFIKKAISIERGPSWSRPNRRYAGTGIMVQGKSIKDKPIPVINVYFDQSGSWSDSDIKVGEEAIGVLNSYVKQGKIKVKLYYFSNNVHSTAAAARAEGGTYGQPILDHIMTTKPDNVVVMTDSDISDCRTKIKLPGGVWFLWKYGRQSENLKNHLSGTKTTEEFNLEYNKD